MTKQERIRWLKAVHHYMSVEAPHLFLTEERKAVELSLNDLMTDQDQPEMQALASVPMEEALWLDKK